MRNKLGFFVFLSILILGSCAKIKKEEHECVKHSFTFDKLATVWDEAIPIGNGHIGALIWQKEEKLRMSLDRADLWDKRPMNSSLDPRFKYKEMVKLKQAGDMKAVAELVKYNPEPGPTKIPAGALEFDIVGFGKIKSVNLNIETAVCNIEWENGALLETFVHATKSMGWYKFSNLPKELTPTIDVPDYIGNKNDENTTWKLLKNLKYPEPQIEKNDNTITYHQKCYGDFSFTVKTNWEKSSNSLLGIWSVSTNESNFENGGTFTKDKETHLSWWNNYWEKSSISLPDSLIENQYYKEMYKFGAVARRSAPAISLQAVWTADDGAIPPWFGDYHNDLNTQLSYWPCYAGNRLDEGLSYLEWNTNNLPEYKNYTKSYFEVEGLNIPGISTIEGKPMGSWVQYSLSVTAAAWVSQHFYWHWKYSMDPDFLEKTGYPWVKEVAIFIDNISFEKNGKRSIALSASPEIYDNSINAWFDDITNFDLSLIQFTYKAASEMASALGKNEEAAKWKAKLKEWPELALGENSDLLLAPAHPLLESHRHHAHLMAIHPLGLVDMSNGSKDQEIIKSSLESLEELGTNLWCGYSFSWLACIKARAYDGEGAAEALSIFANAFCLKNSFHVNGDQLKAGYSDFTYRPFTLEGNFAFAAGVHEMLIQSHAGFINLFPAIPDSWRNVSFNQLRTEGAFLVSANREDGKVNKVSIKSEKGGVIKIKNPFKKDNVTTTKQVKFADNLIVIEMNEGEEVELICKN